MDSTGNPIELTPEELAAETAEALPERAAMSTLTVSGLDAAAGTVEAVGDGVSETVAATPTEPDRAGGRRGDQPEAAPAPDATVPRPPHRRPRTTPSTAGTQRRDRA